MIRFALYCLLCCLSCLPPRRATAQAIKPLPLRVVQLVPGDVVRERLVAMDSVSYHTSLQAVEAIPLADAALADKERELVVTRQQLSASLDANSQLVRDLSNREKDYQNLLSAARKVAGKPPAKSLLLDWRTYALLGAGAASEPLIRVGVKAVFGW